MPRTMPKSLIVLHTTKILGVRDSVAILKISYAVNRIERVPTMILIASHLQDCQHRKPRAIDENVNLRHHSASQFNRLFDSNRKHVGARANEDDE